MHCPLQWTVVCLSPDIIEANVMLNGNVGNSLVKVDKLF